MKTLVWWQYIDNIFVIMENGDKELQDYLEALNRYHHNITFTVEYSSRQINFLDVTTIKNANQFVTDLYVKPTGSHQYLHASPCHFSYCKKSIPFSKASHLSRICSANTFFDKQCIRSLAEGTRLH